MVWAVQPGSKKKNIDLGEHLPEMPTNIFSAC